MAKLTYHDVKVFEMEEHNVGSGKLIWEGTAPVRPDGRFDNAFAERCKRRVEKGNRTIRVHVKKGRYALHFYENNSSGLSHILPDIRGYAIREGYVWFDYRRKKRTGRFIGYTNEGRYGFYFTKDIYQNVIFKEKHPKLNSISEAINWLQANAIGWKNY